MEKEDVVLKQPTLSPAAIATLNREGLNESVENVTSSLFKLFSFQLTDEFKRIVCGWKFGYYPSAVARAIIQSKMDSTALITFHELSYDETYAIINDNPLLLDAGWGKKYNYTPAYEEMEGNIGKFQIEIGDRSAVRYEEYELNCANAGIEPDWFTYKFLDKTCHAEQGVVTDLVMCKLVNNFAVEVQRQLWVLLSHLFDLTQAVPDCLKTPFTFYEEEK